MVLPFSFEVRKPETRPEPGYPITCADDTCAFGGAMSVNGEEGKRPPLTASTVATPVSPGKVMVCADDRGTDFNAFGTRGTQHPVCALFYLDGQL